MLRLLGTIFVAVIALPIGGLATPAMATAVAAPAADKEAAFQKGVLLARAVKASANDPASFEIAEALYFNDGTVALTFRGKNAFGARVINYAVATGDGKVVSGSQQQVAKVWNKYVAGKSGTDMTSSMLGAARLHAY
jgi:hypothetical protein